MKSRKSHPRQWVDSFKHSLQPDAAGPFPLAALSIQLPTRSRVGSWMETVRKNRADLLPLFRVGCV